MAKRYEEYDYEDAFDERGVLPDGGRVRVPMQFMDSVQRAVRERFGNVSIDGVYGANARTVVVDGLGRPAGHRPGACYLRTAPHTTDHAIAVTRDQLRREAYDQFVAELQDAWRGGTSDREVARKHRTGDAVRDAYLDQIDDLQNAWARGSGRR
jgi:hypothetical protein